MKHKVFVAITLLMAFTSGSFATEPGPATATREISILAPFKRIVVSNSIKIVLVQDPYRLTLTVAGDQKVLQSIEGKVVNNQLRISSKKNVEGRNITVYIPVENLSMIELGDGCDVSGQGVLNFRDLTVMLGTNSHAALKVLGKVTIKSGNDCDIVYEKDERYKVIPSTLQYK